MVLTRSRIDLVFWSAVVRPRIFRGAIRNSRVCACGGNVAMETPRGMGIFAVIGNMKASCYRRSMHNSIRSETFNVRV